MDVLDGTTYDDWLNYAKSENATERATGDRLMVVIYDADGRPQRVRGSNVKGQLAKGFTGKK